jgi:DNA-directed RNA polymerase beta subunit
MDWPPAVADRHRHASRRSRLITSASGQRAGRLLANLCASIGKLVRRCCGARAGDLGWRVALIWIRAQLHPNIIKIKTTTIENGLRRAGRSSWGIKAGATGVCQVLSRYSYLATLFTLRRVSTSIDKNSKLIQPRKLHGSQFGVFCPAETKASQLES